MGMAPTGRPNPQQQAMIDNARNATPGGHLTKWLGDGFNAVGSIFAPPKLVTTAGPGLQAAPDATDAALQAARSGEILRQRMSRGRGASFLTGPSGITGPPPIATKTLLGG